MPTPAFASHFTSIDKGGLLCFLSSLPYVSDGVSSDGKFYLALVGQALTGVACPFISCVPTKVSQHWFSDEQRTVATIVLGMSNPMGIVLGQGITPLLVKAPEQVPLMNIVWFIPAGLGAILTMWKVGWRSRSVPWVKFRSTTSVYIPFAGELGLASIPAESERRYPTHSGQKLLTQHEEIAHQPGVHHHALVHWRRNGLH